MVGVNITVYDETRKLYEKYFCESKLLLSTMKYFKGHVQNVQPGKDIELSVYCDRDVFAWLMQYTKVGLEGPNAPKLTMSNIIAILVSSNFLQMDKLVIHCAQYIARSLNELILSSTAVASLSDVLLKKVVTELSEDALEQLWEATENPGVPQVDSSKQNREFIDRLYRLKMDCILRETNSTALRCTACGALFSASHISQLRCAADSGESGACLHQPDNSWKLRTYVSELRAEHATWRGIFWHVWGVVTVLYCYTCHQHFAANEFYQSQKAQGGDGQCEGGHNVHPIEGCARIPGATVDPTAAAKSVHCIKQLKCLEIARRCLQGDDTNDAVHAAPQSILNDLSAYDLPSDTISLGADEGDASEDENKSQGTRVEEKSSPQKYLEQKAAACSSPRLPSGHQGSLLSCIGSNMLELQDFQRRRMGVLQGFLETLRESAPPAVAGGYTNSPRQPKYGGLRRKSGKASRCSTAQSSGRRKQDMFM